MTKGGKQFGCLSVTVFIGSLLASESLLAQGVSFVSRRDFPADSNPRSVAAADFDRDEQQDLAVAGFSLVCEKEECCYVNNVSVLLRDGDGTFRPPVSLAAGEGTSRSPSPRMARWSFTRSLRASSRCRSCCRCRRMSATSRERKRLR